MATAIPDEFKRVTFHVPPDAGPDDSLALLNTVYNNPETQFDTFKRLCAVAEETYNAGGRAKDATGLVQMAGLLLAPHKGQPISLTDNGKAVATAREDKQVDLFHFLIYTGWDEQRPEEKTQLWTYRQTCDLLWKMEHSAIDVKRIRDELEVNLGESFSDFVAESSKVSLSPKSVQGVVVWLERLWPPAVEEVAAVKQFSQRRSCSRELLLLAVDWVYRDLLGDGIELDRNVELLLSRERRELICKLCLLHPASLDRLLGGVVATYPQYIVEGTRSGTYGRFLRMRRRPHLCDDGLML